MQTRSDMLAFEKIGRLLFKLSVPAIIGMMAKRGAVVGREATSEEPDPAVGRKARLPGADLLLMVALLAAVVAIFLYLWLVRMKRPRFDGWITIESLGLYAVLRFGLEFIRDDERGIYFGMSTSQWLSIAVLVFCVWLYAKRKPSRAEEQPA